MPTQGVDIVAGEGAVEEINIAGQLDRRRARLRNLAQGSIAHQQATGDARPAGGEDGYEFGEDGVDAYELEAEREWAEWGRGYRIRPYTVQLPEDDRHPQYATCSRRIQFTRPPLEAVLQKRGWEDATELFAAMLQAKTVQEMPLKATSICARRKSDTVESCWHTCLTDRAGPLKQLRLIVCKFGTEVKSLMERMASMGIPFPSRVLLYGNVISQHLSDKAGLFVKALPSLPAHQQERAFQYAPRSYLVALPCVDPPPRDSQWNLWLEDYFGGDEAAMEPFVREGADFKLPGKEALWRAPQPSLDRGRNMWISKPGNHILPDPGRKASGKGHHFGLNIKVVFAPEDAAKIAETAASRDCNPPYTVFQKYVEQPPLWKGRKVDFRVWALTISANPPVHYLYTAQTLVRVSLSPYTEERSADENTFVTNISLGHREGREDDLGIPWEPYLRFLEENYSHLLPPGQSMNDFLWDGLLDMTSALLVTVDHLVTDHPTVCHLTAWDVIHDDQLHPWVMEINTVFNMEVDVLSMGEYTVPLFASALDVAFRDDVRGANPPEKLDDWTRIPVELAV